MTPPLPDEVQWTLERCDGYMDLSMWDAAASLLKGVPNEFMDHLQVQNLLLRQAMNREEWERAASLAGDMKSRHPEASQHWISLAYALRRETGIPRAREVLADAQEKFPGDPIIAYNLACYDCVEGHHEAAVARLTKVLETYPDILHLIENDEDLEAVRHSFEEDTE